MNSGDVGLVATALVAMIIAVGCSGEEVGTSGPTGTGDRRADAAEPIIINGVPLTSVQIGDLETRYGVRPVPGEYWYDGASGLYGAVGQPAFGFMYPGHDFGTLQRNASLGTTGVIVNGRELPQAEWVVWSQVLGDGIMPGEYWFDQNTNAGYVGNPYPTVNLYRAALKNGYASGSGGKDNIWSTRFSAGNFDSENQRGYVSVPGHGPIGYGF